MVQYFEKTRPASTGHDLFTVTYLPSSSPPKAALCFHHGIQEHVGRYKQAFTRLADQHNIAVYSGDIVGHGKSAGEKSYFNRFDDLIADFESLSITAVDDLQERYGTVPPMFVCGHSMGGLVAPFVCLRDQSRWTGLMLCSPALDVEWTPVLRIQAFLGNIISAMIPHARIVPAVDPKGLNKDPAKVKEYLDDPLNTAGPLPARCGNEILKAFKEMGRRRKEFMLPIYAHHGTNDKVTMLPATMAFMDGVSSDDTTFIQVENGYHEVLFEDGGNSLVDGMAEWMLHRALQKGSQAKM